MIACDRVRRWREKNAEKHKEYQANYKKNHRVESSAYNKKTRDKKRKLLEETTGIKKIVLTDEERKKRKSEYHKKWRKENREKVNSLVSNWQKNNPESRSKSVKEYTQRKKEKLITKVFERRRVEFFDGVAGKKRKKRVQFNRKEYQQKWYLKNKERILQKQQLKKVKDTGKLPVIHTKKVSNCIM